MKIKVGISNRHVHLTEEDYETLFGSAEFIKRNDLSQPGEFASSLTVTIEGNKGKIENVRVLGPLRNYTQVELSRTDCYKLGINPVIKESGDLAFAEEVTISTEKGRITRKCAIVHQRHIHASMEEKERYNLKDSYDVIIGGLKPTILKDVKVKYGNFKLELHLDTDDANACNLISGDEVEIE